MEELNGWMDGFIDRQEDRDRYICRQIYALIMERQQRDNPENYTKFLLYTQKDRKKERKIDR